MNYLALISGGIDSPVAAHLFLKHDFPVRTVIYDAEPFTDQKQAQIALETVERLAKVHDQEIKATIVPFGQVQRSYLDQVEGEEPKYICLFCKRMMLRVAAGLTDDLAGLITGESLGQVASQTLDNLVVIDSAVDLPVYRPLLGLDKNEIVNIAREIKTFSSSSKDVRKCTAVSNYPETHGDLLKMERIEEKLAIEEIVVDCIQQKEEKVIDA